MTDERIRGVSTQENWPKDELDRIAAALAPLRISLALQGDEVVVAGIVDSEARVRLDYSQRQPVRIAVWKLIDVEQRRAKKAEADARRSRAASEDLRRRFPRR